MRMMITWSVNGSEIDTSGIEIKNISDTLTFTHLTTSDSGSYVCRLSIPTTEMFVTSESPKQSEEQIIIIQSKHYNIMPCV